MTNGTGPRPMANELIEVISTVTEQGKKAEIYQTKVMINTLASIVRLVSRPMPTQMSETMAPPVDRLRSQRRPRRWIRGWFRVQWGERLYNNNARGSLLTSIRKIGGNVMITFTIVIPRETKGPKSGSAFDKMALL